MVSNLKLSDLLDFLQQYEASCPSLQIIYIVLRVTSAFHHCWTGFSWDGDKAKLKLSFRIAEAFLQYVLEYNYDSGPKVEKLYFSED